MAIISAIAGFFRALGIVLGLVQQSKDQATGAALQAGADAQSALKAETAIAEAEASAPKDKAGVVSSLESGSF